MKKPGPLTSSKKERVVYWQIIGTSVKNQIVVEFWQKDRSSAIQTKVWNTSEVSRHVEDITGLKMFRLERV